MSFYVVLETSNSRFFGETIHKLSLVKLQIYNMKNILITGAAGYLGRLLLEKMQKKQAEEAPLEWQIIATDIREVPEEEQKAGTIYKTIDIRSTELAELLKKYEVDAVVHLAAIVTPPKNSTRQFLYDVEVLGTKNVLDACVAAGVQKFIVTSSGAAYGYYADNAEWLTEGDAIRGNEEFAYAYHKRLVEELLAEYRQTQPQLKQLIFRVGTILGRTTNNQITNLFDKSFLLGVRGSDSPFVFIWDEDMVNCLLKAVFSDKIGIYNVAGDGALSVQELAKILQKPCVKLPASFIRTALKYLNKWGVSQYGPEQVKFIQYRPVLANTKLKTEFGYTPKLSSEEVFKYYVFNKIRK